MQRIETKATLLRQVFDDVTSDFMIASTDSIERIVAQLSKNSDQKAIVLLLKIILNVLFEPRDVS